ncbi:hypothetical protein H2198_007809 [Neophaeococcomyces mojaviensis]|uniref:Uncharacterized protein n=1 Tax=Neophaeococcomyces mojaviensis TaxID=3383035 RepID=A0ACC2ZZM3_9EURO|nr:hypothetical protein H2198_007809 [Knufia sp. JES_112]
MTDIESFLQRLGLHQYYDAFLEEGFDTWETVLDIQESDLEALNVKLGHRRRLQRAIAEFRGVPSDRPLGSPWQDPTSTNISKPEVVSGGSTSKEGALTATTEQKRKYRRHPKPDENAPEKPPSAYVLFSNLVREEVKADSLSFTEIARLAGERWQTLDPSQKELCESHAAALKDAYATRLAEYKKTDAYNEYMQYLADFKAKHGSTGETKRPKLETQGSSRSSGISVSDPELSTQTPGHARGDSVGSTNVASQMGSSALQLATSVPVLRTPIERKDSSPIQYPQGRCVPGQFPGQSSMSEESAGARFSPSEALSLTARFSGGTPPVGSRSPPATSSRPDHQDYGCRLASQQARTTIPSNTMSCLPASAAAADQWRDSSVDPRSFYTGGASLLPPQSSSIQVSQLVGPHHSHDPGLASSQRTLPPLQRYAGTPTSVPFTGFGGPSTSSPVHHSGSPPNQSETEAADTLAGLAERRKNFQSVRNITSST